MATTNIPSVNGIDANAQVYTNFEKLSENTVYGIMQASFVPMSPSHTFKLSDTSTLSNVDNPPQQSNSLIREK